MKKPCDLKIPTPILRMDIKPVGDKMILACIRQLSKNKPAFATNQYYADWLGCSLRTIIRGIARLEDCGFIEVTDRGISYNVSMENNVTGCPENDSLSSDTLSEKMDSLSSEMDKVALPLHNNHKSSPKKSTPQESGEITKAERDKLFDAVAQICGIDSSLPGNGSKIGQVVKALLAGKPRYTDGDVYKFAELYAIQHPVASVPNLRTVAEQIGIVRNAILSRPRQAIGQLTGHVLPTPTEEKPVGVEGVDYNAM